MTVEADGAVDIEVTLESTRTSRRKEESARKHITLSYLVKGHGDVTELLESQMGNPFTVTIQPPPQRSLGLGLVERAAARAPSLPGSGSDEPDAEITEMIVNGEPAKVRRPRKSNNGHSAPTDVPYSYHAFIEDEDAAGLCGTCHKRPRRRRSRARPMACRRQASPALLPPSGPKRALRMVWPRRRRRTARRRRVR
jgi:hypothetical protein